MPIVVRVLTVSRGAVIQAAKALRSQDDALVPAFRPRSTPLIGCCGINRKTHPACAENYTSRTFSARPLRVVPIRFAWIFQG
jgi:hypothetical protein